MYMVFVMFLPSIENLNVMSISVGEGNEALLIRV